MKRINLKYGAHCLSCGAWHEAGERAVWERGAGVWCDAVCWRKGVSPKTVMGVTAREVEYDPELENARAEKRQMNQEYAQGVEDARRYQFTRDVLGQEEADRQEFERDVFFPEY